ncbi:uncharacterized protein GGS22DRAFT_124408 [Annulohypoxylon maeteangense]|uniref:uncharacterized protein n=1 Tax=Annulohypoxylon maeteangense TaxID=1927788 RepID=UPI002007E14E|nr:uncharacterized protein GGS22DRAFT_124408 [Annulohypoxylon maeteangense]KAI0886114.1 hypothetical protein GGS22DRAFT_124408 [Annulohypoxylon maeteangense]
MYDDYDHRPRDERDYYRRRSPAPRDNHYRSRHESSRSPKRTPPRGPRGEESYRARRSSVGRRRDASTELRQSFPDRAIRSSGELYNNETDYSPAYSPAYDRDRDRDRDHGRGRDRDRHYVDHDDPRGRYHNDNNNRSPRRANSGASSPFDSADDGYYHEPNRRSRLGRPYHTLKLDDIPDRMSTQEIDVIMRDMGASSLVEVRIKSDDRSGARRSYAFAEFRSEDDAIEFLERHYPALDIVTSHGSSIRIPIEYSRERRHIANPDDWKCTMCHFENFSRRVTCKQCKAPRSLENTADMKLDGKSDECPQQTPSQFLVIRDVASSVTETMLASDIKKLYVTREDEPKQSSITPNKLKSTAPIGNTSGLGAKPGSLVRVFMIRDKYSDISCNYGFAEFSTLDDARAAMAKYAASPQFTVASKPITVAYIHSGVFIPYLRPVEDEERRFTFSAAHNQSLRLVYWNPSVYANEFTVFNENLYEDKTQTTEQLKTDADRPAGKDSKKRKAEKDLVAPNGKKVIAMAPQLQKWANKHAELYGSKESGGSGGDPVDSKAPATGSNAIGPTGLGIPAGLATPSTISYADLDKMCCLLCRRKFKSEPSLRRHEQISDMHKAYLDNESFIAKATKDLKALGKEPISNYRDRAKERRMTHNQPKKPKPHLPRKNLQAIKDSGPAAETLSAKPLISKGAGLLAKMGWSTGEGLGAEGGGRTDIIETMAYAPGVGLGAEGGKIGDASEEAARATKNDYADFVSKAKDKARERYEQMG